MNYPEVDVKRLFGEILETRTDIGELSSNIDEAAIIAEKMVKSNRLPGKRTIAKLHEVIAKIEKAMKPIREIADRATAVRITNKSVCDELEKGNVSGKRLNALLANVKSMAVRKKIARYILDH